jgi:dTDP-glucose 4,6-dehydratase
MQPILVTGGAGFIGGEFVRQWIAREEGAVVNLDALTYAGNRDSLASLDHDPRHRLVVGDIGDSSLVRGLLEQHRPRAVLNFAAESHVDRSIDGPAAFVTTNVVGTFRLLDEVRRHWTTLPDDEKRDFRFLHVSTDEVYGSLGPTGHFSETTPYAPNSPYSASKAASDHLVRAYHHTYGLPTLTTNCSNNYGPCQFPEKLIPLMILNCLSGKPLPVYGDGGQIRDWLYVGDHCQAIRTVLRGGRIGEVYNIGGGTELTNKELTQMLLDATGTDWSRVDQVEDRKGHDRRYSVDISKATAELGYVPLVEFGTGLLDTVEWFRNNREWWEPLKERASLA